MIAAEIIAALRRDPDDEQSWAVFGDLLAASGDAHGELIALVQRAAASPAGFQRDELEHRARALFERERRAWLGPLADAALELEWRRGFITRATITRQHRRTLAALLALPVAALLRELVVVRPPSVATLVAELDPTTLTTLELHVRPDSDLSALGELRELRELTVEGGTTEALACLSELPQLRHVELRRFRGQLDALETSRWPPLDRLALTAREDAGALGLDALEPLARLDSLRELDLHDGGWTDLWPLAGLVELERLDLRSTDIVSVEPLAKLTKLEQLALGGCAELTNLEPLAGLRRLTKLGLRYTRVVDLRPLRGLDQLRALDLAGTPVRDLRALFELPRLERVSVEACEIDDVQPLFERGVSVVGVRAPEPSWEDYARQLLGSSRS